MALPHAIIGHTGFVGSNLAEAHAFDARFNSANIGDASGLSVDLLVCAGVRAEKWISNQDPAMDMENIRTLLDVLRTMSARRAILISTTDVYADTRGKTEHDPMDVEGNQPYGANRARMEITFREFFSHSLIMRLPGLFGPYLKKNVIYDLLHGHELHKINTEGVHQYYDVRRLWGDATRALDAGITSLNIATAPMPVRLICREVFGVDFDNPKPSPPCYDMRSIHAPLWGGVADGYLYDEEQVLADLRAFVKDHPERVPLALPKA